jgi:hypothetical protein
MKITKKIRQKLTSEVRGVFANETLPLDDWNAGHLAGIRHTIDIVYGFVVTDEIITAARPTED